MIATWLANKTFQIGVIILAVLGIVTVPLAIIQTVRLDGVSIMGWHLTQGVLAAREQAVKNLGACRADGAGLQNALALQNNRIAALAKAGAAAQARADRALAQVRAAGKAAMARERQLLAAKPGSDLCRSADALILETVK